MRNDTKLAIAAALNSTRFSEQDLLKPTEAESVRALVRRELHEWHDAAPQSSQTFYRGEVLQDFDAAGTDEIVNIVRNLQFADHRDWQAIVNAWSDKREQ